MFDWFKRRPTPEQERRAERVDDLYSLPDLTPDERAAIDEWVAGKSSWLFLRCTHVYTNSDNGFLVVGNVRKTPPTD